MNFPQDSLDDTRQPFRRHIASFADPPHWLGLLGWLSQQEYRRMWQEEDFIGPGGLPNSTQRTKGA